MSRRLIWILAGGAIVGLLYGGGHSGATAVSAAIAIILFITTDILTSRLDEKFKLPLVGRIAVRLLILIPVVTFILIWTFPVGGNTREAAKKTVCISALKQIGRAFELYSADQDQVHPPALGWTDTIEPLLEHTLPFCPEARTGEHPDAFGYAMNAYLSGQKNQASADRPLAFESVQLGPNVSEYWPQPVFRHPKTSTIVLFEDTHVKWTSTPAPPP